MWIVRPEFNRFSDRLQRHDEPIAAL